MRQSKAMQMNMMMNGMYDVLSYFVCMKDRTGWSDRPVSIAWEATIRTGSMGFLCHRKFLGIPYDTKGTNCFL